MRGQIQGNTRRLNHHWQSGNRERYSETISNISATLYINLISDTETTFTVVAPAYSISSISGIGNEAIPISKKLKNIEIKIPAVNFTYSLGDNSAVMSEGTLQSFGKLSTTGANFMARSNSLDGTKTFLTGDTNISNVINAVNFDFSQVHNFLNINENTTTVYVIGAAITGKVDTSVISSVAGDYNYIWSGFRFGGDMGTVISPGSYTTDNILIGEISGIEVTLY